MKRGRRPKLKPYKVSRGSFEEQQLREDKHMQTQRALLFILPVVMVAILAVGIFFGYKSYEKQTQNVRTVEHGTTAPEPTQADPMLLTIVTSAFPLSADYVPDLTGVAGVKVSPDMADSLTAMLAAAKDAGYEILVTEGYISFEEQKERYQTAVAEYQKKAKVTLVKAEATVRRTTPREGESEQQTGLVVYLNADVEGKFEDSAAYAWLLKNCISYGFVLRYPSKENTGGLVFSPHLFRYVGAENAYYITAYDMSFDEYVDYRSRQ